ncbi:hypothetical protein [Bosea sp. 2RAB26]|uniref:hypothetical protein n=1 Tax=Bosea sp. 2RAB26 TaxID=3237476 RepID=UPI003F8F2DC6
MLPSPTPAGTALSRREAEQIIACGGNFELSRVQMNIGQVQKLVVFDPPYRLANGEDYAFFLPGEGRPQLCRAIRRRSLALAPRGEARRGQ